MRGVCRQAHPLSSAGGDVSSMMFPPLAMPLCLAGAEQERCTTLRSRGFFWVGFLVGGEWNRGRMWAFSIAPGVTLKPVVRCQHEMHNDAYSQPKRTPPRTPKCQPARMEKVGRCNCGRCENFGRGPGAMRLTRVCIIPREYPKSDSDELSF
jgi:hypothetical protein